MVVGVELLLVGIAWPWLGGAEVVVPSVFPLSQEKRNTVISKIKKVLYFMEFDF